MAAGAKRWRMVWQRAASWAMPWRAAERWLVSFGSEEPLPLGSLSLRAQSIALALAPAAMSERPPVWPDFEDRSQWDGRRMSMSLAWAIEANLGLLPARAWFAQRSSTGLAEAMASLATPLLGVNGHSYPYAMPNISISNSNRMSVRAAAIVGAARARPGALGRLQQELAGQIADCAPGPHGAILALRAHLCAPGMSAGAVERVQEVFGPRVLTELSQALSIAWLDLAQSAGKRLMLASVAAGSGRAGTPAPALARSLLQEQARAVLGCPLLHGVAGAAVFALAPGHALDGQLDRWAVNDVFKALGPLAKLGLVGLAEEPGPLAWALSTQNKPAEILGLAMWGYGVDEHGPDGLRPIDIAVKKGRSLLFRALIAAGADASTKAPRSKKAPIDLGRKMLRDDLEPGLLARAERESIRAAVGPQAQGGAAGAAGAPIANLISAETLRPRKNRL